MAVFISTNQIKCKKKNEKEKQTYGFDELNWEQGGVNRLFDYRKRVSGINGVNAAFLGDFLLRAIIIPNAEFAQRKKF